MEEPHEDDFKRLLAKIGNLPQGPRLSILLTLSFDQLSTLCEEIQKTETKIGNLASYCVDENFWISFVVSKGYSLPDGIKNVFAFMKSSNTESSVEVIKDLFFRLRLARTPRRDNFEHNLAQSNLDYLTKSKLIVDYVQVVLQAIRNDFIELLVINVTNSSPDKIVFPEETSYAGLIIFLQNSGYHFSTLELPSWLYNIKIDDLMKRRLTLQKIDLMPFLFSEGHLLKIHDETHKISKYYYIHNEDGHWKLYLLHFDGVYTHYLPSVAGRFWRNLSKWTEMFNFYKSFDSDLTVTGFYDLAGNWDIKSEGKKRKFDGYEFAVSFDPGSNRH